MTMNITRHKKKIFGVIALVVIFVLGNITAYYTDVKIATAGPGQPFGGRITMVRPCTCSVGWAVYFTDLTVPSPIALPLIYNPGTTVTYREFHQTMPGAWILGTWTPGGACLVWAGKFCFIIPTAGTMYMVGSS